MEKIPLGRKEDSRLELKAADALRDPEKIAREVVAMLNAEGGDVWVGLREENGRAVKVDPILDPEQEKRRLLDYLIDTIEPRPSHDELGIHDVDEGEGAVLQVVCRPRRENQPFAFLKKGGRHFVLRVGDRISPMSREEILRRRGGEDGAVDQAVQELLEETRSLQEKFQEEPQEVFWLRLRPVPEFHLNVGALRDSSLFFEPARTRNRRVGSNFLAAAAVGGIRPRLRDSGLFVGREDNFELWIYRHEGMLFKAPLDSFHAGVEPGAERPLYWEALLEYPISLFRLLAAMLEDESIWEERPQPGTTVLCHLAMFGLQGWSLRPSSPRWSVHGIHEYLRQQPKVFEGLDLILERPLRFSLEQIRDEPDACGFRVAKRIYESFGYTEEQMPPQFDRQARRLVLPE